MMSAMAGIDQTLWDIKDKALGVPVYQLLAGLVCDSIGAASVALINAVVNIAGLAFPPVMGRIKDAINSYNDGLLIVTGALILGGVPGLIVGRKRVIEGQSAPLPHAKSKLHL